MRLVTEGRMDSSILPCWTYSIVNRKTLRHLTCCVINSDDWLVWSVDDASSVTCVLYFVFPFCVQLVSLVLALCNT